MTGIQLESIDQSNKKPDFVTWSKTLTKGDEIVGKIPLKVWRHPESNNTLLLR